MSNIENLFDINKVLRSSFLTLKNTNTEKKIDLIFEMDTTIPSELRGNDIVFERLLTTILTFIYQNTHSHEILLSLSAPEDFLYEEFISFKIKNSEIPREKILAFLETGLGNTLQTLEGKIVNDKEVDIHLEIPFTIGELGFRRHYRLPTKSMLDKKVLLIVKSENLGRSITKMFKYFPYDVEVKHTENGVDLSVYDLLIIEENLVNESFIKKVQEIQEKENLKFVILGAGQVSVNTAGAVVYTHLLKPVTQESIFELILSIFDANAKSMKVKPTPVESINIERNVDTAYIPKTPTFQDNSQESSALSHLIEEKKGKHTFVLDTRQGLENAKKMGATYSDALEEFLDSFGKSDLYFRQIANEKSSHKIKEFCIDLEKQAKLIGAEGMLKFTDIISLIFVYDKLDMLPIYPGRYHMELQKLIGEIKKYLHIR